MQDPVFSVQKRKRRGIGPEVYIHAHLRHRLSQIIPQPEAGSHTVAVRTYMSAEGDAAGVTHQGTDHAAHNSSSSSGTEGTASPIAAILAFCAAMTSSIFCDISEP